MTTTPPEPTTAPPEEQVDEQLTALETAAAAAIVGFLAATQLPPIPFPIPSRPGVDTAVAAEHYRNVDPTPLVETIRDTLTDTAALAVNASGTPTNPETLRRLIGETLDNVHTDIVTLLQDTARALGGDLTTDPTPPSVHLERLQNDITRNVVTWIYEVYNRIIDWVARTFGLTTEWATEDDDRVCPICEPLDETTPSGPDGTYQAATAWRGFSGRPPAHPWCRCRLRIRTR